jgi:hypothetical protein
LLNFIHHIEEIAMSEPETPSVTPDQPQNATVLNYLKSLYPNAEAMWIPMKGYGPHGGYHPDVSDFLWNTLPREAGVTPKPWVLYSRLGMIHPDNGVICAFMHNEGIFGLRLPEAARKAALETANGPHAYPEAGEDWIRFPLFSLRDKSPSWLKAAYDYAATL